MRHAWLSMKCREWVHFSTFNKRLYWHLKQDRLQPVITRCVVIHERAVNVPVPLEDIGALARVDIDGSGVPSPRTALLLTRKIEPAFRADSSWPFQFQASSSARKLHSAKNAIAARATIAVSKCDSFTSVVRTVYCPHAITHR